MRTIKARISTICSDGFTAMVPTMFRGDDKLEPKQYRSARRRRKPKYVCPSPAVCHWARSSRSSVSAARCRGAAQQGRQICRAAIVSLNRKMRERLWEAGRGQAGPAWKAMAKKHRRHSGSSPAWSRRCAN